MSRLARAFGYFHSFKALVIGDFFSDTYITGRVKRISPEAPVPVLEVTKEESRPGGAGNVALNLAALGAEVFAVGRIGADLEGDLLKERLQKEGVDVSALCASPLYQTPVKKRLIADSQQLIRVDFEKIETLDAAFEEELLACLPSYVARSQVVAISDYAKGFLSKRLIQAVIEMARCEKVPVVVDPKGSDFTKYQGASVLKPNLSEAYAAAKLASSASLDDVASQILETCQADQLLITRSEAGMSLFEKNGPRTDFPVQVKEVKDVTGAGDTVLSCICLALANGLSMHEAAELANMAASISIERLGCVQVTIAEMAQRLLETERDRKVFEETHAYALRHALKDAKYCLLVLPNGQSIPNALFQALGRLKENYLVMVYIDDPHPREEFIHLLSSLKAIDMIVLQKENLKHLCSCMQPQETFLLEEGGLKKISQEADLLNQMRLASLQIV